MVEALKLKIKLKLKLSALEDHFIIRYSLIMFIRRGYSQLII